MKNILTISLLFLLASCAPKILSYNEATKLASDDCQKRLNDGQYSKASEMLEKCQKPVNLNLFEAYYGKDNSDLILLSDDKNIELTKKLESGKITQEQLNKEMEAFNHGVLVKAQKRNEEAQKKAEKIAREEERKRRVEEARLAKYYKEHPEILIAQQQLELQRQQTYALQQQNAIAQQQLEQQRQFQNQMYWQNLAQSLQPPQPQRVKMNCTTNYMGNIASTNCY